MEALDIMLKGGHFDVILVDYHMPIMSGLETINKIKGLLNQRKEIVPFIVLSSSSEELDILSSVRKIENTHLLLKPIKSHDLYKTLKKVERSTVIEIIQDRPGKDSEAFARELDVLLVDDNPVNMVLNNRIMKSLAPNINLTEATNGLQALEECRKKQFSLIIMDVQMPIMSGIEATQNIRKLLEYQHIPIIGVTAGNVLGEKEKCLESGMNDFLPKPMRRADLLEVLKKYISV